MQSPLHSTTLIMVYSHSSSLFPLSKPLPREPMPNSTCGWWDLGHLPSGPETVLNEAQVTIIVENSAAIDFEKLSVDLQGK